MTLLGMQDFRSDDCLKAEEEIKEEDVEFEDGATKNDKEDGEPNSLFYIEQKYCVVCKIEQPLRTKHCRQCNRCVATYDHHCPWIGNCVGERNRRYFFYYLCL